MIEIVLVLYGIAPEQSRAFVSLRRHIARLGIDYELVVYNNDTSLHIPDSAEYIAVNAEDNDMLARAYNYALQRAARAGRKWLLLLDHDTEVTADYFEALNVFVSKAAASPEVVAAVPEVCQQGVYLSPIAYNIHIGPFLYFRKVVCNTAVSQKQCIVGFNSGAVLDVDFITSIGGFSEHYPMDMLDYWYFLQIYLHHRKVIILPVAIEQCLSLMDIAKEMSSERYRNYVASLSLFAAELGVIARLCLKIKFVKDMLSQALSHNKQKFVRYTIKELISIK